MTLKFAKGDEVLFDDTKYTVVEWDEINEMHILEDVNGDRCGAHDDQLMSEEDYNEMLEAIENSNEDDFEEDYDDEDEDDYGEEDPVEEGAFEKSVKPEPSAKVKAAREKARKEYKETGKLTKEEAVTAAAQSIEAKPSAAMDPSKAQMTAAVISTMNNMDSAGMVDFFNKMMAQIGTEADSIQPGQSDQNKSTIAAKPTVTNEEIAEIFGSEELTEEFQNKAKTIFEAAVVEKVAEHVQTLEEAYELRLNEEVEEFKEEVTDQVDRYLSYVAEQFVEKNEIEIKENLQLEMSKSFMNGLRDLFEAHDVVFPEGTTDAVEALSERVAELEEQLDESLNDNIELVEILEAFNKEEVFDEVSEGLAMSQIEKFRTLTESVEFDGDEDIYREKLETIKEHYFKKNPKVKSLNETVDDSDETLNEDHDEEINDHNVAYPRVKRYADAMKRSINLKPTF
jgi:hypothetical protein